MNNVEDYSLEGMRLSKLKAMYRIMNTTDEPPADDDDDEYTPAKSTPAELSEERFGKRIWKWLFECAQTSYISHMCKFIAHETQQDYHRLFLDCELEFQTKQYCATKKWSSYKHHFFSNKTANTYGKILQVIEPGIYTMSEEFSKILFG